MKYLSISIDVKADEVEELEAIIEGYGCLACVISSSTDESSAEEIYETAPGEVRLWLTNKLIAYFAIDQNIIGLGEQLSAFDPDISQRMSFEYVELDSSDNESSFLSVNKIIGNKLSVRQTENFVKIFKNKRVKFRREKDTNIIALELSVSNKIGLNVNINSKKRNKGTISFEYKDLDQLNKIIDVIKNNY